MYTAFGRSALHTRTHLDMVYSLGNSTGSPKVPCQRSMANHRNGHIWECLERLVGWRWGGVLMGKRAWERLSFCQPAQLQGPVGWDLGRHAGGKVEKMTASSFWGCVQSPLLHWGPDATLTQQTTPRDFCEQSFPKLRIHNLQTVVRFGLGPAPGLGDAERGKWRKQTYFKTHQMQQFLRRVQL